MSDDSMPNACKHHGTYSLRTDIIQSELGYIELRCST